MLPQPAIYDCGSDSQQKEVSSDRPLKRLKHLLPCSSSGSHEQGMRIVQVRQLTPHKSPQEQPMAREGTVLRGANTLSERGLPHTATHRRTQSRPGP